MERISDIEMFFVAAHDQHSGTLKLTAAAAVLVCDTAVSRGFVIIGMEGGIWRNPGFEMRLDAIWAPPIPEAIAGVQEQHARLRDDILHDNAGCDTFILTTRPLDLLMEPQP